MQTIIVETKIAAPTERCFLLSLSIDLHKASTAQTSERAIAGVTQGLIGAGESVTWRGRHFGVMLIHESLISQYEKPKHFRDIMTKGTFKSFVHDHYFEQDSSGMTLMRDELRFEAPFGFVGQLVERAMLKNYLRKFLEERKAVIKLVAEGPKSVWGPFIKGI